MVYSYEEVLLHGIKKELGITSNKYNKAIKALMGSYIKGEICKEDFVETLKGYL